MYPVVFPLLPTRSDFDPQPAGSELDADWVWGDNDAQYAWKMFGGLTISEAQQVFDEAPFYRLEDFYWMGDEAFAYYFPVIENHVRQRCTRGTFYQYRIRDVDQPEAVSLASCIERHFRGRVPHEIVAISNRVTDLLTFVLNNAVSQNASEKEREIAMSAWRSLQELSKLTTTRDAAKRGITK